MGEEALCAIAAPLNRSAPRQSRVRDESTTRAVLQTDKGSLTSGRETSGEFEEKRIMEAWLGDRECVEGGLAADTRHPGCRCGLRGTRRAWPHAIADLRPSPLKTVRARCARMRRTRVTLKVLGKDVILTPAEAGTPQEYQFHNVCGIGAPPVPPHGENPTYSVDFPAITRTKLRPSPRSGFWNWLQRRSAARRAGAQRPVLPKPPPPRLVSGMWSTSTASHMSTGQTAICAIRSPTPKAKSVVPVFIRITPTSPR